MTVLAALVVSSSANAEQAGSKAQRLPFGSIDAALFHTCAIVGTGDVRCWGLGNDGRLGYENTTTIGDTELPDSTGPLSLGAGRKALALSAGWHHTCALLDNRTVRCWGDGSFGALGYGNTDSIGDTETVGSVGPVDLGTGRTAVQIAAGANRTCAILDNGTVRCWGDGTSGQLGYGNPFTIGDNETPGSVGPVDLGAGRKAVAITAGQNHTCVILDNGRVRCWGIGSSGQLGTGNADSIGDTETPASIPPVDLGAGRKAVAISAGSNHTCAILDNGKLRCWGYGGWGALGYGNTDWIGDNELPSSVGYVSLGAGRRAVGISGGENHTCAILDNGQVRCWGNGFAGQLGFGGTAEIGDDELPTAIAPVPLGAGRKAVAVSAGQNHTCALLDNGRIRCWGGSSSGQLGYGNTDSIGDNEPVTTAGFVSLGGLVKVKALPAISLALAPRHDRTVPWRVRASGRLTGFLIDSATCSGQVVVKATHGRKSLVARPRVRLAAGRCSYAATLRVRSAGTWRITARFAGNGSLLARTSPARRFLAD